MMKIFKSLAIITAVVAIAGGGTYALWTDSATITGSTFSTTTMDLKIDRSPLDTVYDWQDGFAITEVAGMPADFLKNLYPGYPANSERNWQVIDIKNVGAVKGNATIQFVPTAWSALGDNLILTVKFDGNHDGAFENVASGTLAQFNGNVYTLGEMSGASDSGVGKISSVRIEWSVPASAGNDIQNKSVSLDTVFGLTQVQ